MTSLEDASDPRNSKGSISRLIEQVKAEKRDDALRQIWQRCHERLIRLALKHLQAIPSRLRDEEQVALDAFEGFARSVEQGRFPDLIDRNDLWTILHNLTERKAIDEKRWLGREKRDWKRSSGESSLGKADSDSSLGGFALVAAETVTPEDALAFVEEFQRRLNLLRENDSNGDELVTIATMRLSEFSTTEIAAKLGRPDRHIRRRLKWIREFWEES